MCECSTEECEARGVHTCTTSLSCYSQLLDRCDGTQPITRGCITHGGPNSLLCLNLRPLVHGSWPVLKCCDTNYCNRDVSPTPPTELLTQEFREKCGKAIPDSNPDSLNTIYLAMIGAAVALIITLSATGFFILAKYRSTYSQASHSALDVGIKELKPPLIEASAPPLLA